MADYKAPWKNSEIIEDSKKNEHAIAMVLEVAEKTHSDRLGLETATG